MVRGTGLRDDGAEEVGESRIGVVRDAQKCRGVWEVISETRIVFLC